MMVERTRDVIVALALVPFCVFANGSVGSDEIRTLQRMLNFFATAHGANTIDVDGVEGPFTDGLLKRIIRSQADPQKLSAPFLEKAYRDCALDNPEQTLENPKQTLVVLPMAIECLIRKVAGHEGAKLEERAVSGTPVTFVADPGREPLAKRTVRILKGADKVSFALNVDGTAWIPDDLARMPSLRVEVVPEGVGRELAGYVSATRTDGFALIPVGAAGSAGSAVTANGLERRLGTSIEICTGKCRDPGEETLGHVAREGARIVIVPEGGPRAWTGPNAVVDFDGLAAMYCAPEKVINRKNQVSPSLVRPLVVCDERYLRADPPAFITEPGDRHRVQHWRGLALVR